MKRGLQGDEKYDFSSSRQFVHFPFVYASSKNSWVDFGTGRLSRVFAPRYFRQERPSLGAPAQTRTCGFPASGSSVVLAFAQVIPLMPGELARLVLEPIKHDRALVRRNGALWNLIQS
uniref:Uncharacterized protein n=1 Tax=Candidatus Kentrum sp. LFY TaxID=2126342 RepID=A0A450WKV9_9GAMM|nr:MAG: hypothetical protein BECKLFY1418C_GA0070996_10346 [Candidatus Kentron sp. LFY]